MCRLEFRFPHLPFSKSARKNEPSSCEWEAYPSHSYRVQNVPASCDCSLTISNVNYVYILSIPEIYVLYVYNDE